jgi:glycosyltransferase involved in cell wall biosynthesis
MSAHEPSGDASLRVSILTTAFPRRVGDGQGAFVWEAVRTLVRRGVRVRVVAMHSPGAATREVMQGVEVRRPRYWWPERGEMLRREGGGLPVTWQKYPLARLQIVPFGLAHTFAGIEAARDADLIHAHWTLSGATGLVAARLWRKPLLVTIHGSDIFRAARKPFGAWLARQVLRRADRIMAVSNALRVAAIKLGAPAGRIEVIPDGVDTTLFAPGAPDEREDCLLFVGSLIERKGLRYLLAALPRVFAAHPTYRLVIAGDGPQEEELRGLAAGLGVAEKVQFLGFLPPDEVRLWMRRARLFALPSVEEGLGVVLLEALACGTPVVASDVDGIPDTVTADVGLLAQPGRPEEFATAICSILADPERWSAMSFRARKRAVQVYDWERIVDRWMALYGSLLDSGRRR